MKKIQGNGLILLFSFAYLVSYLTRINFGAVVSEMVLATGFTKQELSFGLTGSFITYGVGQILSGILGDKISPKRLVLIGLSASALMNALMPFSASYRVMAVIWSINGFAQALIWPPIVKLMVALLSEEEYSKGIVNVTLGGSIGTILIYLSALPIISLAGWRGVFFFSAVCGVLMITLWQIFCPETDIVKGKKAEAQTSNVRIFTPMFFVLAVSIVICGMLRDGVATWTPSLVSESFNLSSSSGILSGAVLPVFGVLCYESALFLYRKKFRSPITCAGVIFSLSILSSFVLSLALGHNSVLTVLSVALLNGTMHGANLMLIGILPSYYAKTGKVSTVSGVLNSFVYVGSAASTYGVAVLTESCGWRTTVFAWLGMAVPGTVICFVVSYFEKKNRRI